MLLALAASNATYCCDPAATSMTEDSTKNICRIILLLCSGAVQNNRRPANRSEKHRLWPGVAQQSKPSAHTPDNSNGEQHWWHNSAAGPARIKYNYVYVWIRRIRLSKHLRNWASDRQKQHGIGKAPRGRESPLNLLTPLPDAVTEERRAGKTSNVKYGSGPI